MRASNKHGATIMNNDNLENPENQDELKKIRKNPFTQLENAILEDPEVTKNELLVFWVLNYHADKDNKCFPSIKKICQEARLSERTAKEAIKGLIEKGYITKEERTNPENPKHHFTNLYTIPTQYKYIKKSKEERKQPEKQEKQENNEGGGVNFNPRVGVKNTPEQYKDNQIPNVSGVNDSGSVFSSSKEVSNSSGVNTPQAPNKEKKQQLRADNDKPNNRDGNKLNAINSDEEIEKAIGSTTYTALLSLGLDRKQCFILAKYDIETGENILRKWVNNTKGFKYLKNKVTNVGGFLFNAIQEAWTPGNYKEWGRMVYYEY